MNSFVHDADAGTTTMSELLRVYQDVSPGKFFGCYAYATQSGFRAFELAVGQAFWLDTPSRWLFGIDYGRTDPRALREIEQRANTDVRIFDGAWVVDQVGFRPRRDFHAKVGIMESADAKTFGMVLGSGNFSYNGLKRSVEAGATFVATSEKALKAQIQPVVGRFEQLWKKASPLKDIIDTYELKKAQQASEADALKPPAPDEGWSAFWIEAGYVTKNRGAGSPGNQIFFPNGFREFFGFSKKSSEKKNSIIGAVTLNTLVGPSTTNHLRLNRNGMEKMSLPIPETHGFGVYDGKVLVFEPMHGDFVMSAYEAIEFNSLYGHRLIEVKHMNGGRRYGAII